MKYLPSFAAAVFFSFSSLMPAQGVRESFDYDTSPIPINSGNSLEDKNWIPTPLGGGEGWRSTPPQLAFWATRSEDRVELHAIGKGSLIYKDAAGKEFPSLGNRLSPSANKTMVLSRRLALEQGSLASLVLQATSEIDVNRERSRSGVGAPDGVVWVSFLADPGQSKAGVSLGLINSGYSGSRSGAQLAVSGETGELTAGNNLPKLQKPPYLEKVPVPTSDGNPLWIVARLTFGKNWGSSAEFESLDGFSMTQANAPQPTGQMLVWVNPSLEKEPSPSEVVLTIPLMEFRFDAVRITLGEGTSVDEIRIGINFDEVSR